MKRHFYTLAMLLASILPMQAQQTSEKLNRAPVAVKASTGVLVSWRSLTSDPEGLTFNVYRNGTKVASNISTKTDYLDTGGKAGDTYKIEASNGETSETTAWTSIYKKLTLDRPAGGTVEKWRPYNTSTKKYEATTTMDYYYTPNDMSVGDVDGDGEYEMILKWDPSTSQDNSYQCGYTGNVYIDAYKMDGTRLWRIDLGKNIRAGAHYTQFLVYDFDGDGKAEMICQTAAGSVDGKGNYVSAAATDASITSTDNSKDYRKETEGTILTGPEFLTVFNGETGAAMHTIWYNPNRALTIFPNKAESYSSSWGDSYGNRGDRHNAAVAYLDGMDKLPYAIMQRGYYTQCFLWAVGWDGTALYTKWLHYGDAKSSWKTYDGTGKLINSGSGKSSYGQGVHSISIGDVNNDGYDEIVTGSATVGNEGQLLCSTGLGHGDAIHLTDLCPEREGLEVMMPHEESPYGYDVHDATTGYLLVHVTGSSDNGRGLAGDFIPGNNGKSEFWSSADNYIYECSTGDQMLGSKPDTNFRIYWNGTAYDQTFDGRYSTSGCSPRIRYYNGSGISNAIEFSTYGSPQTCNTTKATPCLQADILGDWREELVMWHQASDTASTCELLIYSTPVHTTYKVPCLMQDHVYRMGVAWQNSSYNQPPHLGYSLPIKLGLEEAGETPVQLLTETLDGNNKPSEDKGVYTGTSFSCGENGELTASASNGYLKIRTNINSAITINVNDGYVITGIKICGYSNNTSTTADRSIDMTSVLVDGTKEVLDNTATFPGGTAGQTPVTVDIKDISASDNIVLSFDNSKITTKDVDANGKNSQLFAIITITYEKADTTGISETMTMVVNANDIYTLSGQKVSSATHPGIYIKNGKKFIVK